MKQPEPRKQRALITGASSGIGAALARRLAARGVEVWLAARRADRLAEHVEAIGRAGGQAHALALDVSDARGTQATVQSLDDEVGGIDLVVANAGIGGPTARASDNSLDDLERIFQTNVTGALATVLALTPRMRERGRGHVVGISSLAADLPTPLAADYGASKAAFSYFLDALGVDLSGTGVSVTIVHPGFVKSELTDKNRFKMPFILETADAARIIDDGILRKARYVRFPFVTSAVMTLARHAPRSLLNAVMSKAAARR